MRRRFADEYEKDVICKYYSNHASNKTIKNFKLDYHLLYDILRRHSEPLKGNYGRKPWNKGHKKRVIKVCYTCGGTFGVIPSKIDSCKNCPECCKKPKVDWNCKYCGQHELKTPYKAKRPYCDKKCMAKYFSENYTGENSNTYRNAKVTKTCGYQIGEKGIHEFLSYPSQHKNFCSQECRDNSYKLKNGKDHPRWKGGDCHHYWRPIIMERDRYKCQICHKTHKERRNGRDYRDIHHIYNREQFPELKQWPGNMITLCIQCHKKYEGNISIGIFEYIGFGLKEYWR